MRAVLQRVTRASVSVGDEELGEIGCGFVILLAVGARDAAKDAQILAEKVVQLRVFDDDAGKLNRTIRDVGGSVLAVAQFTLYADARRGRRPEFTAAAAPADAKRLFEAFCGFLRGREVEVAEGRFGAHVRVSLDNDGPVTIALSTDGWAEAHLPQAGSGASA